MVDKIQKILNKLSDRERRQIKEILSELARGNIAGFDIKKLRGRDDIFRIRKGKIRIIYRRDKDGKYFIIAVERCCDTTYK